MKIEKISQKELRRMNRLAMLLELFKLCEVNRLSQIYFQVSFKVLELS